MAGFGKKFVGLFLQEESGGQEPAKVESDDDIIARMAETAPARASPARPASVARSLSTEHTASLSQGRVQTALPVGESTPFDFKDVYEKAGANNSPETDSLLGIYTEMARDLSGTQLAAAMKAVLRSKPGQIGGVQNTLTTRLEAIRVVTEGKQQEIVSQRHERETTNAEAAKSAQAIIDHLQEELRKKQEETATNIARRQSELQATVQDAETQNATAEQELASIVAAGEKESATIRQFLEFLSTQKSA